MLKVRDLMTETVETVGPNDNLSTLYDLMDERRIRHVPVTDASGDLLAVVTHRDLLKGALGTTSGLPMSMQRDLLSSVKVQELMSGEPATIEPDSSLKEAGEIILEHKLGCLPVVEGNQLVGIITESDFVRHVLESA